MPNTNRVYINPLAKLGELAPAPRKKFERGEAVYHQGDLADAVYLVNSGQVMVMRTSASGPDILEDILIPGEFFGQTAFAATKHEETVIALESAQVSLWSVVEMEDLFGRITGLAPAVFLKPLMMLREQYQSLAVDRVSIRVGLALTRLAERIGKKQAKAEVLIQHINREMLAQHTGTTLFTVSRLLSIWEARGLAKARRDLIEVNIDGLKAFLDGR